MADSIYHGVLLGYLPYHGEFELEHYEGGVLFSQFSDELKSILSANNCYLQPLIGKHCKITLDRDGDCTSIVLNEPATDYSACFQYPNAPRQARITQEYLVNSVGG